MLTYLYNYLCCNMITIIFAMILLGISYYIWSIMKRFINKFKKSNAEIKDILKDKLAQPETVQEKPQPGIILQQEDDSSELTLSSLDEKSSIDNKRFMPKSARDELNAEKEDDINDITFEDLTEDDVIAACPFFSGSDAAVIKQIPEKEELTPYILSDYDKETDKETEKETEIEKETVSETEKETEKETETESEKSVAFRDVSDKPIISKNKIKIKTK